MHMHMHMHMTDSQPAAASPHCANAAPALSHSVSSHTSGVHARLPVSSLPLPSAPYPHPDSSGTTVLRDRERPRCMETRLRLACVTPGWLQEAHIDSAAAIAVMHTLLASAAAASHPINLDRCMCINKHAAAAVAGLCASGLHNSELARALGRIITRTRSALDAAVLSAQRACCAQAELQPLNHSVVAALLQPFSVTVPPLPHHAAAASDGEAKAIANLGGLPELPATGHLTALHAWIGSVKAHDADRECVALIMHEVEEFFHAAAIDILHRHRRTPLPTAQLQQLHAVLEAYAEVVHKFEHTVGAAGGVDGPAPMLSVEGRSREALLVWIMLCLSHRTAAGEFPGLLRYAVPLQPDDLRHLVLRGKTATSAALVVAAYIQKVNCAATAGQVFSTREDATFDLAGEFAGASNILREILEAEERLAEERKAEHWVAVQQKQEAVRELDAKLKQAHAVGKERQQALARVRRDLDAAIVLAQDKCSCAEEAYLRQKRLDREQDIAASAMAASYARGRRTAPSARAVSPTRGELQAELTRVWRGAKAHLKSLKDDRAGGVAASNTEEGRAYIEALQAVRKAEREVGVLRKEISKASEPPPRLVQPLPDLHVHRRFVLALLFFLYPHYTGALALVRQYTCSAQQCFAAPPAGGAAERMDSRDYATWASAYNGTHAACAYGQRPGRAAVEEDGVQLRLFCKRAPMEKLGKQNVMRYHTPEVGVVHPSADVSDTKLVWHGGPIHRYACSSHSDPFQPPADAAAVSSMYTEPGQYSEWLRAAAAAAPSKLCAAAEPCGPHCCQGHIVMDATARHDAVRGNMVLTHQDARPKGWSAEEWQAFAGLRAFPLNQMRELCVHLRNGDLQLQSPHVRRPPPLLRDCRHMPQLDWVCLGHVSRESAIDRRVSIQRASMSVRPAVERGAAGGGVGAA